MRVLQCTQLDLVLLRQSRWQCTALDLILHELAEALDDLRCTIGVRCLEGDEGVRRNAITVNVLDALLPVRESEVNFVRQAVCGSKYELELCLFCSELWVAKNIEGLVSLLRVQLE